MKKIILVWSLLIGIVLFFIYQVCFAEVYVLVNKATKEIQDMSPENDAVIETGYEKIILPGKLADYELQYPPQYYKYQNKKFVVNIKKISEEELARQVNEEKMQEEKLIQNRMRKIAIDKLKEEGVELKHNK